MFWLEFGTHTQADNGSPQVGMSYLVNVSATTRDPAGKN